MYYSIQYTSETSCLRSCESPLHKMRVHLGQSKGHFENTLTPCQTEEAAKLLPNVVINPHMNC